MNKPETYKDLKEGDTVYLWVNNAVIPKGYLALKVSIINGSPYGREPGDHMSYDLRNWFDQLEFEEPKPEKISYRSGCNGEARKAYLQWRKEMPMEDHDIPGFVAGYNAALAKGEQ